MIIFNKCKTSQVPRLQGGRNSYGEVNQEPNQPQECKLFVIENLIVNYYNFIYIAYKAFDITYFKIPIYNIYRYSKSRNFQRYGHEKN